MSLFRGIAVRVLQLLGIVKSQNRELVNDHEAAVESFGDAWLSQDLPHLQWKIVETQLAQMIRGVWAPEFETFRRSIELCSRFLDSNNSTELLEIGCSSGYYSKVLEKIRPSWKYVGVDFSQEFIDYGKLKFPEIELLVGDSIDLPFLDQYFDVVVSGSVLLHVYEWKRAIEETTRVAKAIVILHRTPVSTAPTMLFVKTAYEVRMIEWTFNEFELLATFEARGFRLVEEMFVYHGDQMSIDAHKPVQKTYIFSRI